MRVLASVYLGARRLDSFGPFLWPISPSRLPPSLLRYWTTGLGRALNLIADSTDGRILDNVFRPTDFTVRRTTQSVVGRKLCLPGRPDEPLTAMWARQAYFFRFLAHSELPHLSVEPSG